MAWTSAATNQRGPRLWPALPSKSILSWVVGWGMSLRIAEAFLPMYLF